MDTQPKLSEIDDWELYAKGLEAWHHWTLASLCDLAEQMEMGDADLLSVRGFVVSFYGEKVEEITAACREVCLEIEARRSRIAEERLLSGYDAMLVEQRRYEAARDRYLAFLGFTNLEKPASLEAYGLPKGELHPGHAESKLRSGDNGVDAGRDSTAGPDPD
jgi:hypothetical protein